MNKRLLAGAVILFGLIFILFLFNYDRNLDEEEGLRNPGYLSSYPETGSVGINSESILLSLDQGNTNVFTPLPENSNITELDNIPFSWKQADFLKIASTFGQSTWDDSMSAKDWNAYFLIFETSCRGDLSGFHFAGITYFKPTEISGKKVYATRYIEIDPYYSTVKWGDGATYPQPILRKWQDFDWADSTVTAEDALRISEEHGGKEARAQVSNECLIYISTSTDNNKWYVDYISTDFATYVDPFTGEYEILGSNVR